MTNYKMINHNLFLGYHYFFNEFTLQSIVKLLLTMILYMKQQFNTFAANSPALSDYYSPKNASQRFAFASSSSNDLSRTSALDPLRFITAPAQYNKAYRPDKRVIPEEETEDRRSEGM
jgi:hypothetical protein